MSPRSNQSQRDAHNRYGWLKGPAVAALVAALSLSCFTSRVAATLDIELCSVEPRSVDELLETWTSAQIATPNTGGVLSPTPLPGHTPADPETVEQITATIRQLEACINAGDQFRVYALFSGVLSSAPLDDEAIAEITNELRVLENSTPVPLPADARLELVGPWKVDLLANGRVMAAVEFTYPGSDTMPSSTKLLFFSPQSDYWVIDEMVDTIWLTEGGPVPVADIVGTPPGA